MVKRYHHPQKKPLCAFTAHFLPAPSSPRQPLLYFLASGIAQTLIVNGVLQHEAILDRAAFPLLADGSPSALRLLSAFPLPGSCASAPPSSGPRGMALCGCPQFVGSSVDRHLDCFLLLVIMNNAAANSHGQVVVCPCFFLGRLRAIW